MYIRYLEGQAGARIEILPDHHDISFADFGLELPGLVWLTTLCWSDGTLEAMTTAGGPSVIRRRFKIFATRMYPDSIHRLWEGDILDVAVEQNLYRFCVEKS